MDLVTGDNAAELISTALSNFSAAAGFAGLGLTGGGAFLGLDVALKIEGADSTFLLLGCSVGFATEASVCIGTGVGRFLQSIRSSNRRFIATLRSQDKISVEIKFKCTIKLVVRLRVLRLWGESHLSQEVRGAEGNGGGRLCH